MFIEPDSDIIFSNLAHVASGVPQTSQTNADKNVECQFDIHYRGF